MVIERLGGDPGGVHAPRGRGRAGAQQARRDLGGGGAARHRPGDPGQRRRRAAAAGAPHRQGDLRRRAARQAAAGARRPDPAVQPALGEQALPCRHPLARAARARHHRAAAQRRPQEPGAGGRPARQHPVRRGERALVGRAVRGVPSYQDLPVADHLRPEGQHRTLLAVQPVTGRRHQIRVHLAWIGHPVEGDPLFGGESASAARTALHSWQLGFDAPWSADARIEVEAPPGDDFWACLGPLADASPAIVLDRARAAVTA